MELRSAITANFAVIINGERITNQTYIANYYSISGRTIVGHNGSEWVVISFEGVTGKTGMSGNMLYDLCKDQGCLNALCLDGGGSVYLKVKDQTLISTSRKIKNAFMIYGKEEELDMTLKLVVRKQTLVLRKELKFIYDFINDRCPFILEDHYTKRYKAIGKTLNDSSGKWIEFPVGSEFEVVELLPNLQLDGWQWVKVLYNGTEYYAQYDSMAYSLEAL